VVVRELVDVALNFVDAFVVRELSIVDAGIGWYRHWRLWQGLVVF